eukprot:6685612-Prymnesium_polylepis.1
MRCSSRRPCSISTDENWNSRETARQRRIRAGMWTAARGGFGGDDRGRERANRLGAHQVGSRFRGNQCGAIGAGAS